MYKHRSGGDLDHNYLKFEQEESLNCEGHQHWLKSLTAVVLHLWELTYFRFKMIDNAAFNILRVFAVF